MGLPDAPSCIAIRATSPTGVGVANDPVSRVKSSLTRPAARLGSSGRLQNRVGQVDDHAVPGVAAGCGGGEDAAGEASSDRTRAQPGCCPDKRRYISSARRSMRLATQRLAK